LVSAGGQLIATIGSVTPAGTIATAPGAATATLMKITLDAQAGRNVQAGDVLGVIGNVLSLAGAVVSYIPPLALWGKIANYAGTAIVAGSVYVDHETIGQVLGTVWDALAGNKTPTLSVGESDALFAALNASSSLLAPEIISETVAQNIAAGKAPDGSPLAGC